VQPAAVLFDLGGVLCDVFPDRRNDALGRLFGRPGAEVRALLDDVMLALDTGRLVASGLMAVLRERFNWSGSFETVATAWASMLVPRPEVIAIAARITVPRGLLTNNGEPIASRFQRLLPEVAAVIDLPVFASEIGCVKPATAAYLRACQRMGIAPDRVLFVDDTPGNVAAAEAAGLQAVAFTSAAALESTLVQAGVLGP
jgi:HAD superfamily hydrolase (TIGR01509 family)